MSRLIPIEDFFKNPEKTLFKISPDGSKISYLAPFNNRMNIFLKDLASGKESAVTNEKDRDINSYFWKGNDFLLYFIDTGGDENYKLIRCSPQSGECKCLTPYDKTTVSLIDELYDNHGKVLIALNKRNPELFDVYELDILSGEKNLVEENPGNITEWISDHSGNIRLAGSTDGVNKSLLLKKNGKFEVFLTTSFKESLEPLFFDFENRGFYAASNIARDKLAVIHYDPELSKETEIIFEHPEVDVTGLDYSRKRKELTHISYVTDKRQVHYLDEYEKKIYEDSAARINNNYEVILTDCDDNENLYIVRTYSDRSLGSYYLYDTAAKNLTKLSDVSPRLKEDEMCEMKPVKFSSRDGLSLHGYLTLPQNKESNIPVIINPHGGPWVRDIWGYNPEVQFLSNRGYGVLQINYRGSTGYGRDFWMKGFKEWGKKMQDDLSDGASWLVESGIAEKNKIAIYGGSYGGYAVLAGLAFTPDVYAAGIDYVGVSNLFTFMKTIPPYWKPYLEMMYEMVGNPEKDKELLQSASPVFFADRIKAPLFIAQGKNDPRVNIDESNQMVNALKERGVEVEYLVKDNEGHGFRNEENKIEFYTKMEKFLSNHLK